MTTVSAMIDTMRIGHITGPPLWNLSISQLLPTAPPQGPAAAAGEAAAVAAGDGLPAAAAGLAPAAAGLSAAGFKVVPGAPGCCGTVVVAGNCAGAAGFAGPAAPGLIAGADGGEVCGEAGDCASEVSANASEHRQIVSSVFIVEARIVDRLDCDMTFPLSQTVCLRVQQNFSLFQSILRFPRPHLYFEISPLVGRKASPSIRGGNTSSVFQSRNAIPPGGNAVLQARPVVNCCLQSVTSVNRADT